jgi:ribosomal protein S18 acetylase RimI-like enzyme
MTAIERHGLSLQLDVIFRAAEQSDLPKLEWYGQYTHFRRVFQRAYEDQLAGRRLMLLADVNGWPIGQVFMQLESLDDMLASSGRRGYLYSLRVMDAFQRQGLGTALIREAESILISRNYGSVSIAAAKDNPGARRLYERLGFRVFMEDSGRWQYIDHEGHTRQVIEPCWVLEKQLDSQTQY